MQPSQRQAAHRPCLQVGLDRHNDAITNQHVCLEVTVMVNDGTSLHHKRTWCTDARIRWLCIFLSWPPLCAAAFCKPVHALAPAPVAYLPQRRPRRGNQDWLHGALLLLFLAIQETGTAGSPSKTSIRKPVKKGICECERSIHAAAAMCPCAPRECAQQQDQQHCLAMRDCAEIHRPEDFREQSRPGTTTRCSEPTVERGVAAPAAL
eukprot:352753-Chlamydomonas_euryale.AAC.5